jgi:hypothetical protein
VTYRVTRIDTTSQGHLYVEVDFGVCVNDFIFVNVPTGGYGPATDKFGRWLTYDADQHPVWIEHDAEDMVLRAITAFQAEIPIKKHSGDMRDPQYTLGGLDPRGFKAKLAHLCK